MLLAAPAVPDDVLRRMSAAEKAEYLRTLEAIEAHNSGCRYWTMFPETGPHRRELYVKHMEFFREGAEHRERLFLAANRIGKSESGSFEVTAHLTGRYPDWWEGRRFSGPIRCWAAGKNNETTRDILMAKMMGETQYVSNNTKAVSGTGMIPRRDIGPLTWRRGLDLIDRVKIKHHDASGKFDGWSRLQFKSYEQGRGSFEGTEQEVIYLDEEPPLDIYAECLMRTMTCDGIVLMTFTPLEGMSDVVLSFLPGGNLPADERRGFVETE
jgi:phage terminase large subunit-like protein